MADLTAFLVVAEELSFTRAAVRLGMSQSALSQLIRRLEEGLGVGLLKRTTRSVAITEAGERLLKTLAPAVKELDLTLAALGAQDGSPSGLIRITTVEHAATTVLWPALKPLLRDHPGLRAELTLDYGLTDIIAERYDAGVRMGEDVDKDMIAVRIAPDLQLTVVGAPAYFESRPRPVTPQELVSHQCLNLHLSSARGHYTWPFRQGDRDVKVRVEGPVAFNTITMIIEAALDGFGLAFVPLDQVAAHVAEGRLVRVLADWVPPYPGYHLYYPSRRQMTPAFALLVEALRKQYRATTRL